jgi:hypothetical protein
MRSLSIVTLASLAALGSAGGGSAEAAAPPRVSFTDAPHVVLTGQLVRVRGHWRGPVPRRSRVRLERRVSGSWRGCCHLAARRGRRFSFGWRAPGVRGVVALRLRAVTGGRPTLGRPVRVAVSATRVLSRSRVRAAPAPGSAGTLRYSGRAHVHAGEFVALDIGPQTPFGLLGQVLQVRADEGDTLLAVRPAGVTEAVPEGRIAIAGAHAAAAGATPRDFRSALSCNGGVQAEVSGALDVALDPRFELAWSLGGIDSAEAGVTVRGDARLTVSVGGGASCSLAETSVGTWDAPPLRFFAGPIPVVVVPRTTLYVSAGAEADAAIEAGLSGRLKATAGLRYDGAVHPSGSFDPSFSYTAPKARTGASIGARVIPSITFLMYGQAGPRFDLSTGLQLDATAGGDPWWTLTAPVELRAGLSVPHFADLEIPQRTVLIRTFPVAQAALSAAPQAAPPAGEGPRSERARITWDTAGSDVDLHVWDKRGNHAWFGNPDAVPDGKLSGDDTDGFGPELFSAAPGAGDLTYGLCYFDDRDTGPVRVALRITDAGGAVHESTHLLARKHDHELLGGGGFVPADGWCPG